MAKFKVWEPQNAGVEDAIVVDVYDHEAAAVRYAEQDIDGMMDGIYKHAVDLLVQGEDGIMVAITITTDWDPKFTARRAA